jgi:hypothetical protein
MNSTKGTILSAVALFLGACCLVGACNNYDSCPSKESVAPGRPCGGDYYQCAYDLTGPSPACDGTSTTISSSCICFAGAWTCPAATTCADAATGDDGAGGNDGAASGDDAGGDVVVAPDSPSAG